MRFAALLAVFTVLSGCADTGGAGAAATGSGLAVPGKPSAAQRCQQVLLDVAAMAEGMEGARLSRARRAGL